MNLGHHGFPDLPVDFGFYSPTYVVVTNCSSLFSYENFRWIKIGNLITVYGIMGITQTSANTTTQFSISLPIPTKLFSLANIVGIGAIGGDNHPLVINATPASVNVANCFTHCKATGAVSISIQFNYILQA
jgi:hypothetical protein